MPQLVPCPGCKRPMDASRSVCAFCRQAGLTAPEPVAPAAANPGALSRRDKACIVFLVFMALLAPTLWLIRPPAPAPAPPEDPTPGSLAVYTKINHSTDCAELQRLWDLASNNNAREAQRGNEFLEKVTASYVKATERRMKEIGCPGH